MEWISPSPDSRGGAKALSWTAVKQYLLPNLSSLKAGCWSLLTIPRHIAPFSQLSIAQSPPALPFQNHVSLLMDLKHYPVQHEGSWPFLSSLPGYPSQLRCQLPTHPGHIFSLQQFALHCFTHVPSAGITHPARHPAVSVKAWSFRDLTHHAAAARGEETAWSTGHHCEPEEPRRNSGQQSKIHICLYWQSVQSRVRVNINHVPKMNAPNRAPSWALYGIASETR